MASLAHGHANFTPSYGRTDPDYSWTSFRDFAAHQAVDILSYAQTEAELNIQINNHLRHSTTGVSQEPVIKVYNLHLGAARRYFDKFDNYPKDLATIGKVSRASNSTTLGASLPSDAYEGLALQNFKPKQCTGNCKLRLKQYAKVARELC